MLSLGGEEQELEESEVFKGGDAALLCIRAAAREPGKARIVPVGHSERNSRY